MTIFAGKRPRIDGLTRAEQKRRDALNPEVARRSGEQGFAGQAAAAAGLLRERLQEEPDEYLWPLLLGRQMMSMNRFSQAIDAFLEAESRDERDVRGYYGAGHAYFQAAEAKQSMGEAATDDVVPLAMTVDNLYQESLRQFRRGQELAAKSDREELSIAVSTVERALARKAGRL